MRGVSRAAAPRFLLDFIEHKGWRDLEPSAAMFSYLVGKIESFESRRCSRDDMRIWNGHDSRGPIVMAKYVTGKRARYSLNKFVDVRLIVFPPYPADNT